MKTTNLRHLLQAIQDEMEALQLWEVEPPSAEALASKQPFCIDTLEFTQWLQWVFLPKIEALLDKNTPLPSSSNIHALAEEYFKSLTVDSAQLLVLLEKVDQLITQ
ncbi:YqcC family protein [Zooshikella ganghwensis]|uniref:YqcC family protein n=1 Tax=Zooshikella ganghwensis TaxID=202772 RepID=A0A4P9VU88_9GAMM|nr:YqcC family protein [Zooshikella ganghwensis]RDH46004.1 YqcC family protein [Zooshikella ganghwensis]